MKLVDDAHTLWRRWSTRIAAVQFTAVVAWWGALPAEWKAAVPDWVILIVVAASAVGFMGAQAVAQPNLRKADK
jgi:hypothetical protein